MDKKIEETVKQINDMGEYLYHTTYLAGKKYKGIRNTIDRINKINFMPLLGSTILDLGCNVGGMIWPYRLYYDWAVGVDKNEKIINFCKNLAEIYRVQHRTQFLNCDIDKSIEDLGYLGKFDVIFLLAMTQHLKNWKKIIKWVHEHSELLVIEYNGQPDQIKEYMDYTKTLRSGMDHLRDAHGRFMYMYYNPIKFKFNNKVYETYRYNKGTNVMTYLSVKDNAIIKVFKNKSYKEELKWCNKLDYAPAILYVDEDRDIVVEEFVGASMSYYNVPNDYELQMNYMKKDLIEHKCNGEDVELHVKDGKIRLSDFGACNEGDLTDNLDRRLKVHLIRKDDYTAGRFVTVSIKL